MSYAPTTETVLGSKCYFASDHGTIAYPHPQCEGVSAQAQLNGP